MTPAERALLLAVADAVAVELQIVGMPKTADEISDLISAVEAEAAPEAPSKSCETCDDYRHTEADVCPLCEDGRIFGKWTKCPRCGTGRKEKK